MSALPRGEVRASHVARLAWPVLISMISMAMMNLADTLFAGWLGTSELAAVGLASTVGFFLITPARGLIRGVKILTSHAAGARDLARLDVLLVQGVWLALGLGLLLAPLGATGPWLFHALGASDEVVGFASSYLLLFVGAAPVLCMVGALEGWLQGQGDTTTPMRATLAANLANLALNPLLMFGGLGVPALGVTGAALATVAATCVQLLMLVNSVRGRRPSSIAPDAEVLRASARFGAPLAIQWTVDFGGFVVLLSLLARSGDAELAAHVLVFRLAMFSILPGFAIADAAGVLVGQAIGANRPHAAREAWSVSVRLAVSLMGAFGALFWFAPALCIAPFQPSAEVAEIATALLALAALWQIADAVLMVNVQSLMAAGDTGFTMRLLIGGSWLVQVPLSLWLVAALGRGAIGGWTAITAEILVITAVSTARVWGRGWLEERALAVA